MTVKQLKNLLDRMGSTYDDVQVVRPGGDHSYISTRLSLEDAERDGTSFYEYFSDEAMQNGSVKVKVLVAR